MLPTPRTLEPVLKAKVAFGQPWKLRLVARLVGTSLEARGRILEQSSVL
jgi:hypothetical protein